MMFRSGTSDDHEWWWCLLSQSVERCAYVVLYYQLMGTPSFAVGGSWVCLLWWWCSASNIFKRSSLFLKWTGVSAWALRITEARDVLIESLMNLLHRQPLHPPQPTNLILPVFPQAKTESPTISDISHTFHLIYSMHVPMFSLYLSFNFRTGITWRFERHMYALRFASWLAWKPATFNIRNLFSCPLPVSPQCSISSWSIMMPSHNPRATQPVFLFNMTMRISSQFRSYSKSASNVMPEVSVSELVRARKTTM